MFGLDPRGRERHLSLSAAAGNSTIVERDEKCNGNGNMARPSDYSSSSNGVINSKLKQLR